MRVMISLITANSELHFAAFLGAWRTFSVDAHMIAHFIIRPYFCFMRQIWQAAISLFVIIWLILMLLLHWRSYDYNTTIAYNKMLTSTFIFIFCQFLISSLIHPCYIYVEFFTDALRILAAWYICASRDAQDDGRRDYKMIACQHWADDDYIWLCITSRRYIDDNSLYLCAL